MSEHEPLRPLSASQRKSLETATTKYQAAATPNVRKYLGERGIGPQAADTFRLGVVADPAPGHNRMRGFISIPFLGGTGQPLALRFRCPEAHDHRAHGHGKYMGIPAERSRLFNVAAVHHAQDVIHVAEGEFDAIVLNLVGLPAIGIPGATAWAPHHRRVLAGFNKVFVWGDGDDAGSKFTNTVCRALRSAIGVEVPSKHDVTDIYLAGGANALHALI